ncbi:MAG: hypothetical protein ABS36_15885 [Acidobacteria bacterium SCN 69-37]|nr:MAG: hypothetical protein ABS36_15885 [Acidobacteria bacterium SCN 69-37]
MSTDFFDRISRLSPKRLALLALELHDQLEQAGPRPREPIAVVGLGCRLPGGASSPDAFWDLLREGRDAIGPVPADRWDIDRYFDPDPDVPARMSVRHGGFLDRIDRFDAAFFGISPREAQTMDPQQRLMLEVAWEALEDAGISPESLAGSASGVFLGICNSDHFSRAIGRGVEHIDAYLASGNAHSVASGRLAYCLGLQGPAVSVDTACSSSLVALHLACQSLQLRESRLALAGGVNVMCAPETTIALTKAHMLAPDGRCKTFDAAADGFSRGEGCGVLVLKRLADAEADGDRVLAVIRGTAVNQDGRSGGLTVPSGPAQEAVIRAALTDAGVAAHEVDYVEAHGTGTTLGDPIEVRALAGALGAGRATDRPLLIGSVKTNIGHLESAAGVAGVIKVILSLRHERIPPHLHFTEPSPHIAWEAYPIRVEAGGVAWPRRETPRRAGVSSFGFSGTNAHVILEDAPVPVAQPAPVSRHVHCLPLSARTVEALERRARDLVARLTTDSPPIADVARTLGMGRAHHSERLAVVAETTETVIAALEAYLRGETHPALHVGTAVPGQPPEIAFLFTGQGAQTPRMGRQLYDTYPVFHDALDRCRDLMGADEAGRTLTSVLYGPDADASLIHDTAWAQPALFALEYAMTELWRSWGIAPSAVIGHSLGEYVAAAVAGVFTLDDGFALVVDRGRLMQTLPDGGAMAAIFASRAEVEAAIAPFSGRLAIAAVNAADSVVVSGERRAVEALLSDLATVPIEGRTLAVSLAAHSPLVEPVLAALEDRARRVPAQAPRVPIAWNVTGGALPAIVPDATYWRRHLREPVRFADGIAWLHARGFRHFLEVGPHPTLTALAQRTLPETDTCLVASMRRGQDEGTQVMDALAALYVAGAAIDWSAVCRGTGARIVSLPTYPFEERTFWIPASTLASPSAWQPITAGRALAPTRVSTAVPTFETVLRVDRPACLDGHRVHGTSIVPAPMMLALVQASAAAIGAPRAVVDFTIGVPLVVAEVDETGAAVDGRVVQIHMPVARDGTRRFEIYSRTVREDDWVRHAAGRLVAIAGDAYAGADTRPLADIEAVLGPARPCGDYYDRLRRLGIDLGPVFRTIRDVRQQGAEALARIGPDESVAAVPDDEAHVGRLDGALQTIGLALPAEDDGDEPFLLAAIERLELTWPLPRTFVCHVRLRQTGTPADTRARATEWHADLTIRHEDGSVIGVLAGVTVRRASHSTLSPHASASLCYRLDWPVIDASGPAAPHLARPTAFVPDVRTRVTELAADHGVAVYDTLLPRLDQFSVGHVQAALASLGFDDTPGRRFRAASEADALGVLPRYRRLFDRMLHMLADAAIVQSHDDGTWELHRRLVNRDPGPDYDEAIARFAATAGELRLLRRCGGALAPVLRGIQDPIQLLFPGGSFAEARELYVESPYARTYNTAIVEALTAATAALPDGRRLQVIEIGGGTGGTTTFVLPCLATRPIDYTFTDLSPLFLERAREQFGAYDGFTTALLDIERDPVVQGFRPAGCDVVIAANVLHAAADLAQAVAHARSLLRPGGQLILLEGVTPAGWVDLTFGLTEGWWRFTDTDRRGSHPLIGRDAWTRLLADSGFEDVHVVPSSGETMTGALAQQALIVARVPVTGRVWTIVGGSDRVVADVRAHLEARGDRVTARAVASTDPWPDADEVVYLGAMDAGDAAGDVRAASTLAVAAPIRCLAAVAQTPAAGRVWIATCGAMDVADRIRPDARWQRPVWGVGRVFALEHPSRWGGAVDLDPDVSAADRAIALLTAIDADDGEDQSAWRAGHRHVCRLRPAPEPSGPEISLRPDATYLVTGGYGGLGLVVGRWLATRGARVIALVGRTPVPDAPAIREIEAMGVRVLALRGDVADESSMDDVVRAIAEAGAPPVRGIVHAAAAMSAAAFVDLSPAQVDAMLRPKVEGTIALERLAAREPVEFLVLFSSTTALIGASGLAHYAAANLFLDATAETATSSTCRTIAVDWGTWDVMRLASADDRRGFREVGLEPMPAPDALRILGRAMARGERRAIVAAVDWKVLKPVHEARRARPLLAELGTTPAAMRQTATVEAAANTPALIAQLAGVPASRRRDVITTFVEAAVASVLGLDAGAPVADTTGLFDLGMDSLMSVELKRRLERGTGQALPSTLTFNYPTVVALSGFLETRLAQTSVEASSPVARATQGEEAAPAAVSEDVDLDMLTEEELEARLAARLEQLK